MDSLLLGTAAASGSLPATNPRPGSPPAGDRVEIVELNPVVRLYPASAAARSGALRFGAAELGSMLPFFGPGEVVWTVEIGEPGDYDCALCYSTTHSGTRVRIDADDSRLEFAAPLTRGFFTPYPGGPSKNPGDPSGESFFSLREFYQFERVPVPGRLQLVRGVNVVRLNVSGEKGKEIFRLRSLELTPVAKRSAVEADRQRARAHRANTDWFAHAGYGMWFHFLDLTTPRHGPPAPYEQAVNALDVGKMAATVAECGAKYLIFTVNHGHPTCPAPIRSWEKLHPGWTTKRDLIGELADSLGRHGIRLMLYMNPPGLGGMDLKRGTVLGLPKFGEADFASQLIDVFREFGERYGARVAGYWFDSWFEATGAFPNLPHQALNSAIKAGFPDRLVALNYWVFPVETEWQDYWAGELTDLPLKPFAGRYIRRSAARGLQGHVALRFDADWLHIKQDTPMHPPRYGASELAQFIRSCERDQLPVTLGVGIFQDGSMGEASLPVLKQLAQLVRGAGASA